MFVAWGGIGKSLGTERSVGCCPGPGMLQFRCVAESGSIDKHNLIGSQIDVNQLFPSNIHIMTDNRDLVSL